MAAGRFGKMTFLLAQARSCDGLYNRTVSLCGVDTSIRNPTRLARGLTTPIGTLTTQTRYNPGSVQPLDTKFGAGATLFIFAHEAGHHNDLQFVGSTVPWAAKFSPVPPASPALTMSWNRELRADTWAGCATERAGISFVASSQLQQLTAAWVGPDVPPNAPTIAAINAGYDAC